MYTKLQIRAALVVSDYHSKKGNVSGEECDIAVCEMDGAPLSAILAWALRQAEADTRRIEYFENNTEKFMRPCLYWNDPEGPNDDGGWRVSTGSGWPLHPTVRGAIDSVLPNVQAQR